MIVRHQRNSKKSLVITVVLKRHRGGFLPPFPEGKFALLTHPKAFFFS